VIPGKGPCFDCLFPGDAEPMPSGVLGPVPGVVASVQSLEAVKLILGVGRSLAGRLLHIRGLTMTVGEVTVPRRPDCRACGSAAPDGPCGDVAGQGKTGWEQSGKPQKGVE
jgi:adenylyltransferase/sulfurtransferase